MWRTKWVWVQSAIMEAGKDKKTEDEGECNRGESSTIDKITSDFKEGNSTLMSQQK